MFLNIVMLSGLAGAAVPLILHLLARARYRSVPWGAMMFLAGTDRRQNQNTRLKQWLLLAIRMLLVALIAMAMSRPVFHNWSRLLGPSGRVDAVILLDASASMAVRENDRPRMDLARRAAVGIISQLQRGDQVALLPLGSSRDPRPLSADLQQVVQDVATLAPEEGKADIASALNDAAEILESSHNPNREIYLICDRQAISWDKITTVFAAAWHKRFTDPPPRLLLVPVGGEEKESLAIESFIAQGLPAVAKQPIELEIRLHNFGQLPRADIPLTLTDGRKELFRTTVNIAPSATSIIRTTVQFENPGCRVLTAQIKSDPIFQAGRLDLPLLVVPPLEVLIISGDEREGSFRSESDFLRLALSPWAASNRQGPDPMKVTLLTPLKWQRLDPRKYAVVVLANISTFTEAQVSDIEQYVYSGGGLLITTGNMVQSESFNQLLYRGGAGILPARFGDSMSRLATTGTTIIGIDLTHPIFRFLHGRTDPIPSVSIARHMPLDIGRTDSRTLMTLGTGEPLLLERSVGRGHVLLLASSVDTDWNNLPLSSFFLPFAQSTIRYLASSQLPDLDIARGEPIILNVDDLAEDTRPKILRPDGREEEMELSPTALGSELRYTKTLRPGRYLLNLRAAGETRSWTFVVQPPTEEANLEPWTSFQLAQWQNLLGFEILDIRSEDTFSGTVGAARKGRELYLPLMFAALALCVLDLWLSRHLSLPPRE